MQPVEAFTCQEFAHAEGLHGRAGGRGRVQKIVHLIGVRRLGSWLILIRQLATSDIPPAKQSLLNHFWKQTDRQIA